MLNPLQHEGYAQHWWTCSEMAKWDIEADRNWVLEPILKTDSGVGTDGPVSILSLYLSAQKMKMFTIAMNMSAYDMIF